MQVQQNAANLGPSVGGLCWIVLLSNQVEQFDLWDLLAGHEDVGAEQKLVGVADQELAVRRRGRG
jgi:hypothetical protein